MGWAGLGARERDEARREGERGSPCVSIDLTGLLPAGVTSTKPRLALSRVAGTAITAQPRASEPSPERKSRDVPQLQ